MLERVLERLLMQIGPWLFKYKKLWVGLAILAGLLWLMLGSHGELPSFAQVKGRYRTSDVWVVDRQGYPIEAIRTSKGERSLAWVHQDDVSPSFVRLLKAAEDKRFDQHAGVDFRSWARVFWYALKDQKLTGASTLTMQLANLLEAREGRGRERSLWHKVRQIKRALLLERSWSKSEILEAYINLVSFRGELVGLRAVSFGYFQKSPSGLFDDEAALLVALLRAPNAPAPKVGERACRLLPTVSCEELMMKAKQIFDAPYRLARSRELLPVMAKNFIVPQDPKGVDSAEGLIKTSLDLRIQKLALAALKEQLSSLKDQNVKDGAVLVLRTSTGEVLAYAGNAGLGVASAAQIDGIKMRRQAGSTMKPFVYAQAFEDGLLSPASLLDDAPLDIGLPGGKVYRPRNYDNKFRGPVGAGEALGSSLNVPAVRVLSMIDEGKVLTLLEKLHFSHLASEEYYGHSLALGTVDVSLWELTQAYRQLGAPSSPLSLKTRDQLFEVLAAPEYRRYSFGLDSVLVLPFPTAVKTGTSQDMRDNWCIGWNDDYTVGVWVGNFDGKPMWHVSGVSGAAPVWRAVMEALPPRELRPAPRYHPPEAALPRRSITRIRYPTPDMLLALDPDIPREQQQLPIEIENPQAKDVLYLNDKALGKSKELSLFSLQRGAFHLELRTAEGKVLDKVRFQVR